MGGIEAAKLYDALMQSIGFDVSNNLRGIHIRTNNTYGLEAKQGNANHGL